MNQTKKEIIVNSVRAALGLMFFALGTYLVIQANIGASPWDVFALGLAKTLNILYGNASVIIACTLICIDLLMKEKIGLGTLIDAVVVGKTVDLLNWMGLVGTEHPLTVSIVMMLGGFFIMGYGQYLYMRVGLSYGPRDSFQMAIGRRMPKVKIGVVNIFILIFVLAIGYFLGGPVGIGTLLSPIGVGLMQQLAFNVRHFEPKDIKQQSIIESCRILFAKKSN